METKTGNMIKFRDFVVVVNKTLLDAGINEGAELFIAGSQPVQEDKDDLYNLRLKLIACTLQGDHVDSSKFYLIDPKNVDKVEEERQKSLAIVLEEDFGPKDGVEEVPSDVTIN